jgi:hypothetical protein
LKSIPIIAATLGERGDMALAGGNFGKPDIKTAWKKAAFVVLLVCWFSNRF